jgi:abequosyltransferase
MKKLLTICIPTYHRAALLERQLEWLANELDGADWQADCEVIVSDNCSEDDTPQVIERYRSRFGQFQANRNAENLGWMRNFLYCLNAASGRYTWIIGDDDLIYKGALAYVVKTLKAQPDLALFYLNFSDRNPQGETLSQHWFDPSLEAADRRDGKAIFQKCLKDNIGSVIFISATVFRTQFAQEAHKNWPEAISNWAGLGYWNGYCATQGSVLVTRNNYLECAMGVSYWQKDPKAWFRILHWDIPELFYRLQQLGYPRSYCSSAILSIVRKDFLTTDLLKNLKYYLWCFVKYPRWSSQVVSAYFRFASLALFSPTIKKDSSERLIVNH